MSEEEPNLLLIMIIVLGSYALLAAAILKGGEWLKQRLNSQTSGFGWAIHLAALFGFLLGILLAWSSYQTDHPKKELHLAMPLIFVALVYGTIIIIWVRGLISKFLIAGVQWLISHNEKRL